MVAWTVMKFSAFYGIKTFIANSQNPSTEQYSKTTEYTSSHKVFLFKLRGFQSASELYRVIDRHWSANISANFFGEKGVAWSVRRNPHGR
jgi:hypothetical protein